MFNITQKDDTVLQIIKKYFGGNLYEFGNKNNTTKIWRYNSASFKIVPNILKYFDEFSLYSTKSIEYFKWRESYKIIEKRQHLTTEGLDKIQKFKFLIEKIRK